MIAVEAASRESALELHGALSKFGAELVVDERGEHRVNVPLGEGGAEVVAVLNAIEQYVTQRAGGPARVVLDGRPHTLHPR
jgi:hypothetical protein